MFNGVPFVGNLQDRAMTELMCNDDGEPIYDRTQEHLGSSDAQVALVRRQLLEAVVALRDDEKASGQCRQREARPRALGVASVPGRRRLAQTQRGLARRRFRRAGRRRGAADIAVIVLIPLRPPGRRG